MGRGVGAGIVQNKELYHGDGFGAGEIGHVRIVENGELCSCGNTGCLETKISSRAILKRVVETAHIQRDGHLFEMIQKNGSLNYEDILKAYLQGNDLVTRILQDVGTDLAQALSFLVGILNIQCIVIAGSVSEFGQVLVRSVEEHLSSRVLSSLAQETEVVISSLGEDIVMLGAAALILQNQLGIK